MEPTCNICDDGDQGLEKEITNEPLTDLNEETKETITINNLKSKCYGHNKDRHNGPEMEKSDGLSVSNEISHIAENEPKDSSMLNKDDIVNLLDRSSHEVEDMEAETKSSKEALMDLNEEKKIISKKKISFPECRIDGKPISKDQLSEVLKNHYHYKHDRIYYCNHCEYSTKGLRVIKEHTQKYLQNLEFDCDVCGKIVQGTKILNNHKRIHNSNSEGIISKYECEYCPNYYGSITGLNHHQKSVHEGIQYSCTQCEYKSTTENFLTHHLRTIHEGFRYNCSQCDKKFTQKGYFKEHVKTKHEGVRYKCGQCNKKFTTNHKLNRHIKGKHEGIQFPCDLCEYQASYQDQLKFHIKSKHEGVR